MAVSIIICAVTCVFMILSILFKPSLKIGRLKLDSYCLVALAGAVVMIACGCAEPEKILSAFTSDDAVNPLKILTLLISRRSFAFFLTRWDFSATSPR